MNGNPTEIKNELGLGSMYDQLKSQTAPAVVNHMPPKHMIHATIGKNCNKLKNNCYKHLLLDIYCKILPLDKDYIDGNMGQMKCDIDGMLQAKGMTPSQYLTSAYESTHAPLLDFIIRAVNGIGQQYMEDTEKKVDDDQARGIDAPVPEPPEDPAEDEEINDQLVDVENDTDYDSFVDELKKKTIDKIVSDVSKIINDTSEETNMQFNPKPLADVQEEMESTTSIGLNYLQLSLYKEHVDTSEMTEDLLGLAIRESTLHQFDVVFRQPGSTFREFVNKIRYNSGSVINESAVRMIVEDSKSPEEVDSVVSRANKERDEKINSKLKASDVVDAKDKDSGDGTK